MVKKLADCSKKELIHLISNKTRLEGHWRDECRRLKGDLLVIKQRLKRMYEDIMVTKTAVKGNAKVRYYPGGKGWNYQDVMV